MSKIFAVVWLSLVSPMLQSQDQGQQIPEASPANAAKAIVKGEVVSADGPIAGAKVFLFRDELCGQIETEANGKFQIELNSDVPVSVFAFAAGKTCHIQSLDPKQKTALENPVLKVALAEQLKPLGGRIIDFQGMGVPDAKLRISSLMQNGKTISIPTNLKIEELETTTDENGAFQLAGIQPAMVAAISVSGSDIASATLTAASFAKEIVLVAQPSRKIRCRVIDRVSREPVANVSGSAISAFAGIQPVQSFATPAVYSDENGVFELNGLPAFQSVTVIAQPAGDKAYLRSGKPVPIENGFDVVEVQIELEPAVWVDCKVKEFGSGDPAAAEVFYFPTPENEKFQSFVESFLIGGQRLSGNETDSTGDTKVAAIPGPGAIAIVAAGFPANDSVNKLTDEQRAMFLQITQRNELTAIEWIDPKNLKDKIELDFLVSKGRAIEIVLSGEQVSPSDHLVVHGAKSKTSKAEHFNGAKFNAEQFQPGETRKLLVHVPQKKLGAVAKVKAEADSPVQIELRPTGRLTGQIVDADGQPQQGLAVELAVAGANNKSEDRFDEVMRIITDANGRFNVQSLIASVNYRITATRLTQNSQMMEGAPEVDSRWIVAEALEINENEMVDLGSLEFGSSELPKPERLTTTETLATEKSMPPLISGKIVNANGEAVVDAEISFNTWPERTDDAVEDSKLEPIVLAQSRSDSDGYFQLPLDGNLDAKIVRSTVEDSNAALIVAAGKMGTVQVSMSELLNPGNLNVQMNRDKVVRGKVSDATAEQNFRVQIGQKMVVYDDVAIRKIIEALRAGESMQAATGDVSPVAKLDPLRGGLPITLEFAGDQPFLFRGVPINAIFELHVFDDSGLLKTITVVSRPHAAIDIKLSEDSTAMREFHGSRINLKLDDAKAEEQTP